MVGRVGTSERRDAAVAAFDVAWKLCPERALLLEVDTMTFVRASDFATAFTTQHYGVTSVGRTVFDMLPPGVDPAVLRDFWRDLRGNDTFVIEAVLDPGKLLRVTTWPLLGFEGEYAVVLSRNVDLGMQTHFDDACLAMERWTNASLVVVDGEVVFRNPAFDTTFGELACLDEVRGTLDPEGRERFDAAVADAELGKQARPTRVSGVAAGRHFESDLAVVRAQVRERPALIITFLEVAPEPVVLPEQLSAREAEVVDLLLEGRRVRSIAEALFISENTVRNHLRNVFMKLGVTSQRELIDSLRGR